MTGKAAQPKPPGSPLQAAAWGRFMRGSAQTPYTGAAHLGIVARMDTRQPSPTLHAAIGALQGFALWSLHESVSGDFWPPDSAPWIWALAYLLAMAPLSWQLLPGVFANEKQRVGCALLLGLAYAGLGAHAGWQNMVPGRANEFPYVFVAIALAFVLLGLIGGWDAAQRRLDYKRHFETAWRNGLLLPLAFAVTGLLWALLWAGAMLMNAIGLHGLEQLLKKDLPQYLVAATCVSWVIGNGLARPATLLALRHFVLTLVSWLLPLALILALCWVVALPFTGLEPLFATRNAASYAFWFAALSVALLNAAFQDGASESAFAPRLTRLLAWAWLCMVPITIIGDWALARRVSQYGWTPDRVWAAYVGLLLTLYAVGYASSLLRKPGRWMRHVPVTNWSVCGLGVVLAIALISPVGDAYRMAVQSQLSRLESGLVADDKFDWRALAQMGHYGQDALHGLAKAGGKRGDKAAQALRVAAQYGKPREKLAPEALAGKLVVLPQGRKLDPQWLAWVTSEDRWGLGDCDSDTPSCIVWLKDLDGDGKDEVVLINDDVLRSTLTVTTYALTKDQKWARLRSFSSEKSLAEWRTAIEQDRVQLVNPRWPDLELDGERHGVN